MAAQDKTRVIHSVVEIDEVVGKTRFVGTVTRILDPVATAQAEEFIIQCLLPKVPHLIANQDLNEAGD